MTPKCLWCGKVLSAARRRDSLTCSQSCRQARHRARIRRVQLEATGRPLLFAYADPPYPGKAHLYANHPDFAGEVDMPALLSRLQQYDGWALSTSAAALPVVLAACVAQDLKPYEPVIFCGGRTVTLGPARRVACGSPSPVERGHPSPVAPSRAKRVALRSRSQISGAVAPSGLSPVERRRQSPVERVPLSQVEDVLDGPAPRRRRTLPEAVLGMKPPQFCEWVFRMLGAGVVPGDRLHDLFPGSGMVSRCWRDYTGVASAGGSHIRRSVPLLEGRRIPGPAVSL
jgi:hypothetical protein